MADDEEEIFKNCCDYLSDEFVGSHLRVEMGNPDSDDFLIEILRMIVAESELETKFLSAKFWNSLLDKLDAKYVLGGLSIKSLMGLKEIVTVFLEDIYQNFSKYKISLDLITYLKSCIVKIFKENKFNSVSDFIAFLNQENANDPAKPIQNKELIAINNNVEVVSNIRSFLNAVEMCVDETGHKAVNIPEFEAQDKLDDLLSSTQLPSNTVVENAIESVNISKLETLDKLDDLIVSSPTNETSVDFIAVVNQENLNEPVKENRSEQLIAESNDIYNDSTDSSSSTQLSSNAVVENALESVNISELEKLEKLSDLKTNNTNDATVYVPPPYSDDQTSEVENDNHSRSDNCSLSEFAETISDFEISSGSDNENRPNILSGVDNAVTNAENLIEDPDETIIDSPLDDDHTDDDHNRSKQIEAQQKSCKNNIRKKRISAESKIKAKNKKNRTITSFDSSSSEETSSTEEDLSDINMGIDQIPDSMAIGKSRYFMKKHRRMTSDDSVDNVKKQLQNILQPATATANNNNNSTQKTTSHNKKIVLLKKEKVNLSIIQQSNDEESQSEDEIVNVDDNSNVSKKPMLDMGASAQLSRLFGNRNTKAKNPYTIEEDHNILKFIIKSRRYADVKGNQLWKDMEAKNVNPNRTWQSMKTRFQKTIALNLQFYVEMCKLDSEEIGYFENHISLPSRNKLLVSSKQHDATTSNSGVRKHPPSSNSIRTNSRNYSLEEDEEIVKFVMEQDDMSALGRALWQKAERHFFRHQNSSRTWQSLRERFIKRIVPQLYRYESVTNLQRALFLVDQCAPFQQRIELRKLLKQKLVNSTAD